MKEKKYYSTLKVVLLSALVILLTILLSAVLLLCSSVGTFLHVQGLPENTSALHLGLLINALNEHISFGKSLLHFLLSWPNWLILGVLLLLLLIWEIVILVKGRRRAGTALQIFSITGAIICLTGLLSGLLPAIWSGLPLFRDVCQVIKGRLLLHSGLALLGCIALFIGGMLLRLIPVKDVEPEPEPALQYDPVDKGLPEPMPISASAEPVQAKAPVPEPVPVPAPATVDLTKASDKLETPVQPEKVQKPEKIIQRKFCRFCGSPLVMQNALFCHNCGKPQE